MGSKERFRSGTGREVRFTQLTALLCETDFVVEDVATLPVAPVFNASATHGLGTFGSSATGFNVTNGAFSSTVRAYPSPHHLQRNFTLYVSSLDSSTMPKAVDTPK